MTHVRMAPAMRVGLVGLTLFASACAEGAMDLAQSNEGVTYSVTARLETTPVPHSGDAADDSCVWVHPTDPSQSTIIGTDKLGGIAVYDLTGRQISYRGDGNINNIDIRYGFPLGSSSVALVGGTNRSTQRLSFWKVNADRTLSPVGSVAVSSRITDVYGFTLYHSAASGKFYALVVDKDSGTVEQYELSGASGQVTGTMVRQFDNGGISEGMVADDALGRLYVAEETVAIWRYGAEPSSGTGRTAVDRAGAGRLTADIEGLAIYYRPDGTGYLIASSQGSSRYAVYERQGANAYINSFQIAGGAVDGVTETDGIEVSNVALGPGFPEGVFIAQDDVNDSGNQNFKLVPWGTIARAFSPALAIDTSYDPRTGAGTGGGTSGGTDAGTSGGTDAGTSGGTDAGTSGGTDSGTGTPPSGSTTGSLIASGASWRYLDNGSNAGTNWRAVSFDDSAWKQGSAELGYGDGDERTIVSYGPSSTQKYITTYFRKSFQLTSVAGLSALKLRLKRDDGAVVYLNGTEVYRTNMPTGTVSSTTLASLAIEDETYYEAALPTSLLVAGANTLAVEIHQAGGDSSDVSFDAELLATNSGTGTGTDAGTGTCVPTSCAAQGKNCGSISDGCGGTLTCGTCTSPQSCGGGGTANVCGGSSTQDPGWVTVVNDQFDSGGVPSHWSLYDGPYGSGPGNCATPSHVTVAGGAMHILMRYESSGNCGAGWYSGGMQVAKAYGSVDQRVTVRFRVVNNGVSAHRIIPMRWPDTAPWPTGGEEDFCEGSSLTGCSSYLHYGSSNSQVSRDYSFDMTQWHTLRFERRNFVVRSYIDDMTTPVWTYQGSSTTLPATVKRTVLQQECRSGGCPSGTTGTEDIQIDWITIENPSS